ncbi:MAG: hypothetical protein HFH91_05220 [Lachnospiraceae bacterium]|nr:hypothetical protein [Lachnospiraceae bacterium]
MQKRSYRRDSGAVWHVMKRCIWKDARADCRTEKCNKAWINEAAVMGHARDAYGVKYMAAGGA